MHKNTSAIKNASRQCPLDNNLVKRSQIPTPNRKAHMPIFQGLLFSDNLLKQKQTTSKMSNS